MPICEYCNRPIEGDVYSGEDLVVLDVCGSEKGNLCWPCAREVVIYACEHPDRELADKQELCTAYRKAVRNYNARMRRKRKKEIA